MYQLRMFGDRQHICRWCGKQFVALSAPTDKFDADPMNYYIANRQGFCSRNCRDEHRVLHRDFGRTGWIEKDEL